MNPALLGALIQLAIQLEPAVAELLIAVLQRLIVLVNPSAQQTLAQSAVNITTSIAAAHPDWPPEQVQRYATDALAIRAAEMQVTVAPGGLALLTTLAAHAKGA